jgi:vanillate O-demethylase monooxygenase subunit
MDVVLGCPAGRRRRLVPEDDARLEQQREKRQKRAAASAPCRLAATVEPWEVVACSAHSRCVGPSMPRRNAHRTNQRSIFVNNLRAGTIIERNSPSADPRDSIQAHSERNGKPMFLHNYWHVAAFSEEISDRPLARTMLGEPLVLYRLDDGDLVALEDRCVHRQAPLSLGELVDGALQCRYHGLAYGRTGACVRVPGQRAIPPGARVRAYPAVERQGFAFVWMGDPHRAEVRKPYDFPWADKSGWRRLHARFHAACDYRLLLDNLTDLTHLAFAHKTTIGTAGVVEGAQTKTERDGDRVRITRWMLGIESAPAHVQALGYAGKVDRWQVIEFAPPGFVWLKVGSAVAGTGAPEGRMDGVLLDRHTLHAITPETAATTHYFWTTTHEAARLNREQETVLYEQTVKAFHEDLTILEGQQQRLDPSIPTIDLNADAGALQFRRVLARLLEEESTGRAREPLQSRRA